VYIRLRHFALFLCLTGWCPSVFAQLGTPNASGVSLGHIHLLVPDPEEHKKLWVSLLGAEVAHSGSLELLKIPGIFIILGKADTTEGTVGSSIDHFGFQVKDLAAMRAKTDAAHLEVVQENPAARQFVVLFPDKVKVEFTENSALTAPVVGHHIHVATTRENMESVRAWYVKTFGAVSDTRRGFPTAGFNGGEINVIQSDQPTLPTKGRALDHIGFEVRDLEAFCKRLEAQGVKVEIPYYDVPRIMKTAFVTDPAGTRIELTEGLTNAR
jgi:catechol 2,3-dioxygenase-like lactoylglutathione lyase family enzyme